MNNQYIQERDEAATSFSEDIFKDVVCKPIHTLTHTYETAVWSYSDCFRNGADWATARAEEKAKTLVDKLKWAVKQESGACIVLVTEALKQYESSTEQKEG